MMEGLTYFPMGVFQEEVRSEQGGGRKREKRSFIWKVIGRLTGYILPTASG